MFRAPRRSASPWRRSTGWRTRHPPFRSTARPAGPGHLRCRWSESTPRVLNGCRVAPGVVGESVVILVGSDGAVVVVDGAGEAADGGELVAAVGGVRLRGRAAGNPAVAVGGDGGLVAQGIQSAAGAAGVVPLASVGRELVVRSARHLTTVSPYQREADHHIT